jgi:hypothetical protein
MSRQINLFVRPTKQRLPSFSAIAMLQIFGLLLVAICGIYVFAHMQMTKLDEQARLSKTLIDAETTRLSKFTSEMGPRQASKLLADEVLRLEAQLKERERVMETLKTGAIGNTEGFSEYMAALARQSVSGLWLTGFTISGAGHNMAVQGRVTTPNLLPEYIQRLNQEKTFQGRTFSTLEMSLPKLPPVAAAALAKDAALAEKTVSFIDFKLFTEEGEKKKLGVDDVASNSALDKLTQAVSFKP